MQPLSGTVQRYDWGTNDAIPALLGRPADDRPVAEYWLGAHSSSPSLLGSRTLVEHIGAVPAVLGRRSREAFGEHLPYLMKVLSARHALSIQAHPSREQAIEGFARESRSGTPLDAAERTYKDCWPKPEVLIALDDFHSLAGFRDPHETAALFAALGLDDFAENHAPFVRLLRARLGCPEIHSVDIAVREEQAAVVGMIVSLSGNVLHRKVTRDHGARSRAERIEVRLIAIGCKVESRVGFAIDLHQDAARRLCKLHLRTERCRQHQSSSHKKSHGTILSR